MAPYKDKEKNSQAALESMKRLYYPVVPIRLRKNKPEIWEALEKVSTVQNIAKAEYARAALIEQLIRDGYLPAPEE